jgi:predicted ATP-dependent serine protease
MTRKNTVTGIRKPMSAEAKAKIAEAVRASAARKRLEAGIREPEAFKRTKPLELIQMRNQTFEDGLFHPMTTGKDVDELFSTQGGIPKATNYMVVGDPGVGKSTVTLDILSDLESQGFKVLFISAEMTRIDLFGYVKRYPKFGNVDTLFLGEYMDDDPRAVFEESLKPGYDVVLIDSFAEVQDSIRAFHGMTSNATEKFIIDTLLKNNLGENDSKKNTTFLIIQQVTKGGVFVGSQKLKHNTTGMLEIRFDKESDGAFLMFTKNRRGKAYEKLHFSLQNTGDVSYFKMIESDEDEDNDE